MTTQRDAEDGPLVEREGVDAGSAASTAEGPLLTGGTTTGRAGDAPVDDDGSTDGPADGDAPGEPVTQPAQVWAESSGVADPDADYASESGQDEGGLR